MGRPEDASRLEAAPSALVRSEDRPRKVGRARPGRQDGIDQPVTWLASVNAAYLGEYLDRDTAMTRVEKDIEDQMKTVFHDWGLNQGSKAKDERRTQTG
jgi:hypothetical protein